jgi:hypothetical protein
MILKTRLALAIGLCGWLAASGAGAQALPPGSPGSQVSTAATPAPSQNLAPGFSTLPAGATVLLFPIDIELFNITAGGIQEPKADWTANALQHMKAALKERKEKAGLNLKELDEAGADDLAEFSSLYAAVLNSITIHSRLDQLKLPTKEGKMDWSLGDAVKEVHAKTQADYGLFVFVRDSYASAERKAVIVGLALLGVGIPGGIQVGYASLVDLKSGQIVWANQLARASGDLREAEPARQTIDLLMGQFPASKQ